MGLVLAFALSLDWPEPPPELWEAQRFCSWEIAQDQTVFAWEHDRWLKDRWEEWGWNMPHLVGWMEDAAYCRKAWELCREAQNVNRNDDVRRKDLADLRELIGRQNFAAGRMPPPVPVWRFRRVD